MVISKDNENSRSCCCLILLLFFLLSGLGPLSLVQLHFHFHLVYLCCFFLEGDNGGQFSGTCLPSSVQYGLSNYSHLSKTENIQTI